jgi:hypothetical protein
VFRWQQLITNIMRRLLYPCFQLMIALARLHEFPLASARSMKLFDLFDLTLRQTWICKMDSERKQQT